MAKPTPRARTEDAYRLTADQARAERALPLKVRLRIALAFSQYARARVFDLGPSAIDAREAWLRARRMIAGDPTGSDSDAPSPKLAAATWRRAGMAPEALIAKIDARLELLHTQSWLPAHEDTVDADTTTRTYDLVAVRAAAPGLWEALDGILAEPGGVFGKDAAAQIRANPRLGVISIFQLTMIGPELAFEEAGAPDGALRARPRVHEAFAVWRQAWLDAPRVVRAARADR